MERYRPTESNGSQLEQLTELIIDLATINPDFLVDLFTGFGKSLSSQVSSNS